LYESKKMPRHSVIYPAKYKIKPSLIINIFASGLIY
jgi:hypothetical protein